MSATYWPRCPRKLRSLIIARLMPRNRGFYILAIGIDAYGDQGWALPGTSEVRTFPKLSLAVGDAKSFAAEAKKAAAGFYSDVKVRTALDGEATPSGGSPHRSGDGGGDQSTRHLHFLCRCPWLFASRPLLSHPPRLPGRAPNP